MVQGQVFLKKGGGRGGAGEGAWHFSYLILSKSNILHLEITLPFAK